MYISVTRLEIKHKKALPRFFYYTIKSIFQVRKEKGLVHYSIYQQRLTYFWTLTVWDNRESMMSYRNSSHHLKAMKVSRQLASNLDYMFWEGDDIPGWDLCQESLIEKVNKLYG